MKNRVRTSEGSESLFRTHPYMQRRWKQTGRRLAFDASTVAQWRTWRKSLTAKLKELIGYNTMTAVPPRAKVTGEVDCGSYVRQRMELRTEDGIIMPLFVMKPKSLGPWPVMIAPHGHCGGGKIAVAGIADDPIVAQRIEQYNYAYAVQFVNAGYVVFAPDARGMGERRESPATALTANDCLWLNQMALSPGQTVTGMWTWDLHRLIDYIQTRRDCLPDRIGCAGLSGGGMQTLWAAALDDRIGCAIVSGYMFGFKEGLLDTHNCACNYVPHLFENVDMGDIGALIAPRPLMIETGSHDLLNGSSGLGNVRPQVAIMRKAYALLDARDHFKHVVFDGPHRWHGLDAVPWLNRWLGPGATKRNGN